MWANRYSTWFCYSLRRASKSHKWKWWKAIFEKLMTQPSTNKRLLCSMFIQDQKLWVTRTQRQRFDLEIQDTTQEDEKLSEIVNLLETNTFDNSVSRLVTYVLSEVNL